MELTEAYHVLNEMMNSFENWFQIDESDTQEDLEFYKDRFAGMKLCLELGEYTVEDYDYLFYIRDMVMDHKEYYTAIGIFIKALYKEYGRI